MLKATISKTVIPSGLTLFPRKAIYAAPLEESSSLLPSSKPSKLIARGCSENLYHEVSPDCPRFNSGKSDGRWALHKKKHNSGSRKRKRAKKLSVEDEICGWRSAIYIGTSKCFDSKRAHVGTAQSQTCNRRFWLRCLCRHDRVCQCRPDTRQTYIQP